MLVQKGKTELSEQVWIYFLQSPGVCKQLNRPAAEQDTKAAASSKGYLFLHISCSNLETQELQHSARRGQKHGTS